MPFPAVSLVPLEADGDLAFLTVLGPLAVTAEGTDTGAATGMTTGTPMGTATTGTALPLAAGAVVCAAVMATRARRKKRDLNMVLLVVCESVCNLVQVLDCEG